MLHCRFIYLLYYFSRVCVYKKLMSVAVCLMISSVMYASDDKGLFATYAACGKKVVSIAEQGAVATTLTEKSDAVYQIKKTLYGCWLTDRASITVPTYNFSGPVQRINSELSFGKKANIVFHPSMKSAAPIHKDSDHTPEN